MNIDRLTKLKECFLANAATMLKGEGDPAEILAQPQVLSEANSSRIKARITALETEKSRQMSRIDAEIASLKRELDGGSSLLDTVRAAASAGKPALTRKAKASAK
jgi:hypothetical protein